MDHGLVGPWAVNSICPKAAQEQDLKIAKQQNSFNILLLYPTSFLAYLASV
jgi:hypothetical protein